MDIHGIFINHRHDHRHLAGRVYDYFRARGLDPFLDVYSLTQGDYVTAILQQVEASPYFLCVLTPGALDGMDPNDPEDLYYRELELAFQAEKSILVIASEDFVMPSSLPAKIASLPFRQRYTILNDMSNFFDVMDRLYSRDIQLELLDGVLNWRTFTCLNSNTLVLSRSAVEKNVATLENRFGRELIQSIRDGVEFHGQNIIQEINIACYAASLILTPSRDMIDKRAFDRGMMFEIFARLLQDEDFSLTLITNTPDSHAARDAVTRQKLGNSALAAHPEAIFLGSYASTVRLLELEPYKTAARLTRFQTMVTDSVMPFAFFQIIYKPGWEEFNHIKIDLYTEGLSSSIDRRSMLFFEADDRENYDFFAGHFQHLKDPDHSKKLIAKGHSKWIKEWEDFQASRQD